MQILIGFIVIIFSTSAWSQTSNQKNNIKTPAYAKGGSVLKAPAGQLTLENSPIIFKWDVVNPNAKTITLKVYQYTTQGKTLLGSYDFTGNIESAKLADLQLLTGSYSWELYLFDENSAQPISQDQQSFQVVSEPPLNLKTNRFFVSVASGRGDYKSDDPNFALSFQTTPTSYKIGYAGGGKASVYKISYAISDFTIRGSLEKFETTKAQYAWRVLGSTPFSFELFVGPHIRYISSPLITSTDGSTLIMDTVKTLNAGLVLNLHSQLSERSSFVSSLAFDNTVNSKKYFSGMSYKISIGALYTLRDPIGLGMDISYLNDEVIEDPMNPTTKLVNSAYSISGKILYRF